MNIDLGDHVTDEVIPEQLSHQQQVEELNTKITELQESYSSADTGDRANRALFWQQVARL